MGKCNSKQAEQPEPLPLSQQSSNQIQQPSDVSQQSPDVSQVELQLQHLFEAIYESVIKAQHTVQVNNLQQLLTFFPENEQGVHTVECVKLELPPDKKQISIPIATLVNLKTVSFSSLKVKTNIGIQLTENGKLTINPADKTTELEMNIQLGEPMEMVQRILTRLHTQI